MQVRDEYQNIAAIYDVLFSRALREIRSHICTTLTHLRTKTVIDLCCGTGEQLRMLEGDDILLTGVDRSQAMLARARHAGLSLLVRITQSYACLCRGGAGNPRDDG